MRNTTIKRGRPAGMRARHLGLKQALLEQPDVCKAFEKVVSAALDNEHKNHAVAQKIPMGRILPISTFDNATDFKERININTPTIPIKDEKVINEQ